MLSCPLILTYRLSTRSSSSPNKSTIHSSCSPLHKEQLHHLDLLPVFPKKYIAIHGNIPVMCAIPPCLCNPSEIMVHTQISNSSCLFPVPYVLLCRQFRGGIKAFRLSRRGVRGSIRAIDTLEVVGLLVLLQLRSICHFLMFF